MSPQPHVCGPYYRVQELCPACTTRRRQLLGRLRVRRHRHPERSPLTPAILDPDTVETVLRALTETEHAELAIRRIPTLANNPAVTGLLAATQALTNYLRTPLAEPAAELTELDRPGGHLPAPSG